MEKEFLTSYSSELTITSSATSGLPSDPVGMKAHDRPGNGITVGLSSG